ncbi:unnamed protein product, partial [Mesorhabditis belari]|uniref:Enamelin n=1 Tax=Mesorhabditis belari TaxID=2138241 RepID=A0AAF3EEN8_9BILA
MANKWAQDDDDDDNADNPQFLASFAQSQNSNQANAQQGKTTRQGNSAPMQQSDQRSNAPPQPIVQQQNSLSNRLTTAYVEYRGSFPVNAANLPPIVRPEARYPLQSNYRRGGNSGCFPQQHPQQMNYRQQPPRHFPGQSFQQIQQYDRGQGQNYQQQQYPPQVRGGEGRSGSRGHDSQKFTPQSGSDRQFQYNAPRRPSGQLRNGYRPNGQLSYRGSQNPSGTRTFELITGDEHLENENANEKEKAAFVVCAFNPMHLYPSSGIQAHQSTCPNRPVSQ